MQSTDLLVNLFSIGFHVISQCDNGRYFRESDKCLYKLDAIGYMDVCRSGSHLDHCRRFLTFIDCH